MTVQTVWPLLFLCLIPVLVLLYILKQKAKEQSFSSILLWKETYKNIEANTPFEKFRNQLLFYIQLIILLLLIFALLSPALNNQKTVQQEVVFVVDTSASMRQKNGNQTRFSKAIKEAKKELSHYEKGTKYTLVTCDAQASIVYQGTNSSTVKKRLDALKPTMESGTLEAAVQAVNTLLPSQSPVKVCCYTDTKFDTESLIKNHKYASLQVTGVYQKEENAAISYLNYEYKNGQAEALCKVQNFGEKESTQDVTLYLDEKIMEVQTVHLKPKQSEIVYFKKFSCKEEKNSILKAQLSKDDALQEDNVQQKLIVPKREKRVLLVSEGNVFLEKALALAEQTKVIKTNDMSVIEKGKDAFDLYVFDGQTLTQKQYESLPSKAAVLLVGNAQIKQCMEKEQVQKDVLLSTEKTSVTKYMEDFTIEVAKTNIYQLPEWANSIFSTKEKQTAAFYGQYGKRQIGVLGFDLHDTDFALKTEYPMFMAQLCNQLLHVTKIEKNIKNFPTEESEVSGIKNLIQEGDVKSAAKIGAYSLQNIVIIVVFVLLCIEWLIYTRQIFSTKKKQYAVIRVFLLGILLLSMAGITIPKKQIKNETIFLVDMSDSMTSNSEDVRKYLKKTIEEMPKKNSCGVVVFGKDSQVEQFLSDEPKFYGFTAQPITTATNIEKAIHSASTLFDDEVQKNLVLITDGSQNAGNINQAAAGIKAADISLSVLKFEDCISTNPEVYIDGVKVPEVIHGGDHYTVSVSMKSNVETTAKLSLYLGRNLQEQKKIQLTKGENEFIFGESAVEGNIAQYKAVVEPERDTIRKNNTYVTFAQVETQPKILLIEGKSQEAKEFEKVLDAANIGYDVIAPTGAPQQLSELMQYKAVVSVNVYYDDLREGFAKALQSYVKDYAGGYVCIGGADSYALGGYRDTELEKILPVKMDLTGKKEIPKISMALVIDHSGSMGSPADSSGTKMTNLDLAKQAADSAILELRQTDEVGVLAFDDTYDWLVPMQQAKDKNSLSDAISMLNYGGGTSIYPAFQEAYEKMLKSDAKLKHIILLTDGEDDFKQYQDLINRVNQAKITVSTVAVGMDSDKETLSDIAHQCDGRFYYTDAGTEVPRIFAQEVYLQTKSYRINEDFYPTITNTNLLPNTVQKQGLPMLRGYIATTPKEAAEVILTSKQDDPILATWKYGLGKTVAWTSDALGSWSSAYAGWKQTPEFWGNIIQSVMSNTKLGEDQLSVEKEEGIAKIQYQTKKYDKATEVEAIITDDAGKEKKVTLDAVKPGVFEKELDTDEVGVYQINVRKIQNQKQVKSYNTAFANEYSPEYRFSEMKKEFEHFISQSGGRQITKKDNVWKKSGKAHTTRVEITTPLLILALFILLFDIAARRLGLNIAGMSCGIHEKLMQKVEGTVHKKRKRKETKQKPKEKTKRKKQEQEKKQEGLDMQQLLKKKEERQK